MPDRSTADAGFEADFGFEPEPTAPVENSFGFEPELTAPKLDKSVGLSLLSRFGRGLTGVAYDTVAGALTVNPLAALGPLDPSRITDWAINTATGMKDWRRETAESIRADREQQVKQYDPYIRTGPGIGTLENRIGGALESGASLVPALAFGPLGAGATISSAAAMAAEDARRTAREVAAENGRPLSQETEDLLAGVGAAAGGLSEYSLGVFKLAAKAALKAVGRAGTELTEEGISQLGKSAVREGLLAAGKGAIAEPAQEMIEEGVNDLARVFAGLQDSVDLSKYPQIALESALIGTVAGGTIAGASQADLRNTSLAQARSVLNNESKAVQATRWLADNGDATARQNLEDWEDQAHFVLSKWGEKDADAGRATRFEGKLAAGAKLRQENAKADATVETMRDLGLDEAAAEREKAKAATLAEAMSELSAVPDATPEPVSATPDVTLAPTDNAGLRVPNIPAFAPATAAAPVPSVSSEAPTLPVAQEPALPVNPEAPTPPVAQEPTPQPTTNEPNNQTTVSQEPPVRQDVPEPRVVPVVPEQPAAQAPAPTPAEPASAGEVEFPSYEAWRKERKAEGYEDTSELLWKSMRRDAVEAAKQSVPPVGPTVAPAPKQGTPVPAPTEQDLTTAAPAEGDAFANAARTVYHPVHGKAVKIGSVPAPGGQITYDIIRTEDGKVRAVESGRLTAEPRPAPAPAPAPEPKSQGAIETEALRDKVMAAQQKWNNMRRATTDYSFGVRMGVKKEYQKAADALDEAWRKHYGPLDKAKNEAGQSFADFWAGLTPELKAELNALEEPKPEPSQGARSTATATIDAYARGLVETVGAPKDKKKAKEQLEEARKHVGILYTTIYGWDMEATRKDDAFGKAYDKLVKDSLKSKTIGKVLDKDGNLINFKASLVASRAASDALDAGHTTDEEGQRISRTEGREVEVAENTLGQGQASPDQAEELVSREERGQTIADRLLGAVPRVVESLKARFAKAGDLDVIHVLRDLFRKMYGSEAALPDGLRFHNGKSIRKPTNLSNEQSFQEAATAELRQALAGGETPVGNPQQSPTDAGGDRRPAEAVSGGKRGAGGREQRVAGPGQAGRRAQGTDNTKPFGSDALAELGASIQFNPFKAAELVSLHEGWATGAIPGQMFEAEDAAADLLLTPATKKTYDANKKAFGLDGKNLDEVLKKAAAHRDTPAELKALFEHLLSRHPQWLRGTKAFAMWSRSSVGGVYNESVGVNVLQSAEGVARSLAHEVSHVILEGKYQAYLLHGSAGLTTQDIEAIEDLEKLRLEALKSAPKGVQDAAAQPRYEKAKQAFDEWVGTQPAAEQGNLVARYYGLIHPVEFVPEATSNPQFQAYLATLKAPKVKSVSLWQKVKDQFRLLVLGRSSPDGSILSKAVDRSIDLLSSGGLLEAAGGRQYSNAVLLPPGGPDMLAKLLAHHGTPHEVDRFSLEKIGTGEGAQSYGWGLYFAQNREVAEMYKKALAQTKVFVGGKEVPRPARTTPKRWAWDHVRTYGIDGAIHTLEKIIQEHGGIDVEGDRKALDILHQWNSMGVSIQDAANVYTVELDVNDEDLLDWDKPLSEQPPKVREALVGLARWSNNHGAFVAGNNSWGKTAEEAIGRMTGSDAYRELVLRMPHGGDARRAASSSLLTKGIPGIRYKDQGSRNLEAREDFFNKGTFAVYDGDTVVSRGYPTLEEARLAMSTTYNYVLFDESKIRIVGRNGESVSLAEDNTRYSPRRLTTKSADGIAITTENERLTGLATTIPSQADQPAGDDGKLSKGREADAGPGVRLRRLTEIRDAASRTASGWLDEANVPVIDLKVFGWPGSETEMMNRIAKRGGRGIVADPTILHDEDMENLRTQDDTPGKLKFLAAGVESFVYEEPGSPGVVWKFVPQNTRSHGYGIAVIPTGQLSATGKPEFDSRHSNNPLHFIEKMRMLNVAGVPTELIGRTENGTLILRQEKLKTGDARLASSDKANTGGLTLVDIPPGVLKYSGNGDIVFTHFEGAWWMVGDLHDDQVGLDRNGVVRLVDFAVARVPLGIINKNPDFFKTATDDGARYSGVTYEAGPRRETQALHRWMDYLPGPVRAKLLNKTYIGIKMTDLFNQAADYIESAGDPATAFALSKTDATLPPDVSFAVRNMAVMKLKEASDALKASGGIDAGGVLWELNDTLFELSSQLMEERSIEFGQRGAIAAAFDKAVDPAMQAAIAYKKPGKQGHKKLKGQAEVRKIRAVADEAKAEAAEVTTNELVDLFKQAVLAGQGSALRADVNNFFAGKDEATDLFKQALLGGGKADIEATLDQFFDNATRAESSIPVLEQIKAALVKQFVSRLGKEPTTPAFLDRLAAEVRSAVDNQFDKVVAEKEEPTREELLGRIADVMQRAELAEDVFNRINAASEQDGTFDTTKIRALTDTISKLVDFKGEITRSLASRRTSKLILVGEVLKANPTLTEAQAEKVAVAIEKSYDARVKEVARRKLEAIAKASGKAREILDTPMTQRLVNLINMGAFNEESFYNALAQKLRLPAWDEKFAAEIEAEAQAIQASYPEGSLARAEALQLLQAKIAQRHLKEAGPLTRLSHILSSVFSASILSGPPTQIVNAAMTNAAVNIESLAEAVGHYTKARKAGASNADAMKFLTDIFRGYGQALGPDGFKQSKVALEAWTALRKGTTRIRSEKLESLGTLEAFSVREGNVAERYMGALKYVSRVMAASDAANQIIATDIRKIMYARAKAIESGLSGAKLEEHMDKVFDATGEARAEAEEQAREEVSRGWLKEGVEFKRRVDQLVDQALYEKDYLDRSKEQAASDFAAVATYNGPASGLVGWAIDTTLGELNSTVGITKVLVPFTRILSSIINSGLNYSPVGLLRARNWSVSRWLAEQHPADSAKGQALRHYVTPAIEKNSAEYYAMQARAAAGTSAFALLLALALSSADDDDPLFSITANGPVDPVKRREAEQSGKWSPNTIRIGKVALRYNDWPAVNLLLGVVGSIADSAKYGDSESVLTDRMMTGLLGIANVLVAKNLLSGLSNLFVALSDPNMGESAMKKLIASGVSGFTAPQAVKWVNQTVSGNVPESRTLQGWLLSMTPVAAYAAKPSLNLLGEPIETTPVEVTTRRFGNINEVIHKHPILSPLFEAKLYVPPARAGRFPDGKKMTDEQQYRYAELFGAALKRQLGPEQVEALVRSAKLDRESAQEVLTSRIGGAARQYALAKLMQESR